MKYLLTMTTSGRRGCFEATLGSFFERVTPQPTEVFIYDDGRKTGVEAMLRNGELAFYSTPSLVTVAPNRRHRAVGFCKATGACWKAARESSLRWWFHLEDDFVIRRSIDLTAVAHVLSLEPDVAQMSLMRNAMNEAEVTAGGLYESRPRDYRLCGGGGANPWLEHRSYFTTNPSLLRTDLAKAFAWPSTSAHCEGEYGLGLRMALPETRFGVWGLGDPWVEHIGDREGFGY